MPNLINVSHNELIERIKLSGRIDAVIEEIINRKIIIDAAQAAGINVEPDELQQGADTLRIMNNLSSADVTWLWLQKNHLSLDEFEQLVYENVLTSKLTEYLFAEQVEPFFVEHQLDYQQVVMYEVVLDDKDLGIELFYAIKEGEISFPEVAQQYIQDTELRRCGGYKGMQSRKDLKPEISAAVFAATPPQILKPIITSEGIHLVFVEEIILPQLDDELYLKIITELFNNWLERRIEDFDININLKDA